MLSFRVVFAITTIALFGLGCSNSETTPEPAGIADIAYAVLQTTDGGFLIAGSTGPDNADNTQAFLFKTNNAGDTVWARQYGGEATTRGYHLITAIDEGYLVTGLQGSDVYLLHTDDSGNVIWEKTLGAGWGSAVAATSDGGYLIAGSREVGGGVGLLLIKTDGAGNAVWEKLYGVSRNSRGNSLTAAADGGFVIVGYHGAAGVTEQILLTKINAAGDSLWMKTYGNGRGYGVVAAPDGGFVVAGWTDDAGHGKDDVSLIKVDDDGAVLWQKTLGGEFSERGFALTKAADGGYVITGRTASFGAVWHDLYLFKTDAAGDSLWAKLYGGDRNDIGSALTQSADGGFVIAGYTGSFVDPAYDVYLVKIDGAGEKIWEKTYGEFYLEPGQSVSSSGPVTGSR